MIELLVVVAVISILATLLLPALKRGRQSASDVTCLSQLRQIAYAYLHYAEEHGDTAPYTHGYPAYPSYLKNPSPYSYLGLAILDALYIQAPQVFLCPDEFTGRAKFRLVTPNDDINSARPYLVGPSSYGMDAYFYLDSGDRRTTWSRVGWNYNRPYPPGQTLRWQEFPATKVGAIKRPSASLSVADGGSVGSDGKYHPTNFLYPGSHAAQYGADKGGAVFGRHGNAVTAIGPYKNFPMRSVQLNFADGHAAALGYWEVQQNRNSSGPPHGHVWGKNDFQYWRNRNG